MENAGFPDSNIATLKVINRTSMLAGGFSILDGEATCSKPLFGPHHPRLWENQEYGTRICACYTSSSRGEQAVTTREFKLRPNSTPSKLAQPPTLRGSKATA